MGRFFNLCLVNWLSPTEFVYNFMIFIKLEWLKTENYLSRKQYNTEAGKFYPIYRKRNFNI